MNEWIICPVYNRDGTRRVFLAPTSLKKIQDFQAQYPKAWATELQRNKKSYPDDRFWRLESDLSALVGKRRIAQGYKLFLNLCRIMDERQLNICAEEVFKYLEQDGEIGSAELLKVACRCMNAV